MATILIADDALTVRHLLQLIFRGHHRVLEAEDGWQAMTLAVQVRPDLVILDVAMPIMSGLDVCRQLRADPNLRHIGIIILSWSVGANDAHKAGADRYLEKPCLPSQLRTAVHELLLQRAGAPTIVSQSTAP